jgi:hypothetical protein
MWETFTVNFSIFHDKAVNFKLSVSRSEVGDSHPMSRAATNKPWLHMAYGTPMRPYQASINLKQYKQTTINEHINFTYSYSIGNAGREYGERT